MSDKTLGQVAVRARVLADIGYDQMRAALQAAAEKFRHQESQARRVHDGLPRQLEGPVREMAVKIDEYAALAEMCEAALGGEVLSDETSTKIAEVLADGTAKPKIAFEALPTNTAVPSHWTREPPTEPGAWWLYNDYDQMRAALQAAAEKFREYERHHLQKHAEFHADLNSGPGEGAFHGFRDKAKANAAMAERCEAALSGASVPVASNWTREPPTEL